MDTESYLSWLPPRPTNIPSTPVDHERTLTSDVPTSFGRTATSRLVRVISVPEQDEIVREPHPRRHVQSNDNKPPRPRFNAPNLHLEILTSPNTLFRLYFLLFRIFIFSHLLLQTFFDFNIVYIIVQISKFPQPQAGSGRSWSLAAAAYIACWALQISAITIMYELVYLFIRRWRVKRPPIAPIYLTSSSFNFVAIQSYAHFCFINAIRYGAFTFGNIRDGLAETCWFYSQNLPTVTLLLPRAAISIVLLLNFSSVPSDAPTTGIRGRDGAFFREDGTLTDYSRGILFVNAAWTAWRALILLCSWIGLWILSEQGCAGICGPRYRWEEADYEKRGSALSDDTDHTRLPWDWRDCTKDRIQEIYELCLVTSNKRKRSSRRLPPAPIIPIVYTERSPLNSPITAHTPYTPPTRDIPPSPHSLRLPFPAADRNEPQVETKVEQEHEEEHEQEEEEVQEEDEEAVNSSEEEPRLGGSITSASLSSLGNPLSLRHQFHHRRQSQSVSDSLSSGVASGSGGSRSQHSSSQSSGSIIVPPVPTRKRNRAGTVPVPLPSGSTSTSTGHGRPRARTRLDSATLQTVVELGMSTGGSVDDHHNDHGHVGGDVQSQDDHEEESPTSPLLPPSRPHSRPESSFIQRNITGSPSSHHRSHSSSTGSLRSRLQSSIRSRAQSLVNSVHMADESPDSSESGHSSEDVDLDAAHRENWTFGRPPPWKSTGNGNGNHEEM